MTRYKPSIEPGALTLADLEASSGKGPQLHPDDIANTYYNDEDFLAALTAERGSPPTPQDPDTCPHTTRQTHSCATAGS